MGNNNKICPRCSRKMKQQFIGLQHCKCGMSWKKDLGFFERTSDMVFCLRKTKGKKCYQPVIRSYQNGEGVRTFSWISSLASPKNVRTPLTKMKNPNQESNHYVSSCEDM